MKILVGVDGSEQSKAAVHVAHELATSLRANLQLASVVEGTAIGRNEAQAARARLEKLASEYRLDGVPASIAVLDGPPAEALAYFATVGHADLLVVGYRDHAGCGGMVGSTSALLLRRCRKPILVVKRDGPPPRPGLAVLAATDGSPEAASALRLAASIAEATAASLRVASVAPERFPYAEAVGTSALRNAREKYGGQVVRFEKLPLHGVPAIALAEAASRPDVAMLVIGNCGHDRTVRGPSASTAETLVRICPVPLLVAA